MLTDRPVPEWGVRPRRAAALFIWRGSGDNTPAMSDYAPFSYTDDELRSYLPTGWTLLDDPLGSWSQKKETLSIRLEDGADMPWDLEIRARDVHDAGRIEALDAAMDRLYKGRLGKRTKGLGF